MRQRPKGSCCSGQQIIRTALSEFIEAWWTWFSVPPLSLF
jgi:hypothetical protein